MNSRHQRINVTIGELVFRGFPSDDRDAIATSLIANLRELWGSPGSAEKLGGSRAIAKVRMHPMRISGVGGVEVGSAAARKIDGALKS